MCASRANNTNTLEIFFSPRKEHPDECDTHSSECVCKQFTKRAKKYLSTVTRNTFPRVYLFRTLLCGGKHKRSRRRASNRDSSEIFVIFQCTIAISCRVNFAASAAHVFVKYFQRLDASVVEPFTFFLCLSRAR